MSIRSFAARLLVPLFVASLMAASATPAVAIGDNVAFEDCDTSADTENCILSFKVNDGAEIPPQDDDGLELDVFFTDSAGMLQIQVTNGDDPGGLVPTQYELETLASTSDEFTMVIRVGTSFDPRLLIGAGTFDTWTWDDGTTELTIVASPVSGSFAIGPANPDFCDNPEPTDGRTPGEDFDEGGICATADVDYDVQLSLAVDDLDTTGVPAEFLADAEAFSAAYRGGYVATDGQSFIVPSLDPSTDPPSIFFEVSAPHLMDSGAVNTGFFHVLLPEPVFTDLWLMEFDQNSPPSIGATADGSSVSLQAPVFVPASGDFPAGWLIKSNTITYSSPTISLAPASSSSVDEPTEFDLSTGGTSPATTRLPVALPDTGEVTRQVTLQGTGATLVIPQGTTVTQGGVPFTGVINPPERVQGRPAGLRSAVSVTATGTAEADSASALADEDIVFDPPVTITLVDTSEEAAASRVVRIAPDGSITDLAGTMTGRGVQAQITGLGTYGLATELDLAEITSAPSISVALPVALPADGVIDFPTTLNGDTASIAFVSGTTVTDADGAAFAGTVEAPAAATAPSGTGSVVEIATSDGTAATFTPAATLTLTPPEGTSASEVGVVEVTSATATSCLAAISTDATTEDATTIDVSVAGTGTFGLALPVTAEAALVERDWTAADGLHSQWAGQSVTPSLCAGQVAEISVLVRNTGMTTWEAGSATPVVLATNAPPGNTVAIDSGLVVAPLYESRLATHEEASVAPGAVGTFSLKVRAPAEAGTYRIDVRPVAEGLQWLEDEGIYLEVITR